MVEDEICERQRDKDIYLNNNEICGWKQEKRFTRFPSALFAEGRRGIKFGGERGPMFRTFYVKKL